MTVLADLWSAAGQPDPGLEAVSLTGSDPVLPSSFAVGTAAQATIAAAALAANELWRLRTGRRQRVGVDMRHAAAEFRSERYLRVDGEPARGYKVEQFAEAFARVLGVTRVTRVTPDSTSQAGRNAGNACNANHTNGTPLPGDEFYPLFLAEAGNAGHIAEDEFSELYAHHKLVERARRARSA